MALLPSDADQVNNVNDFSDDAASSMLTFFNMASARISLTLDKPLVCKRKMNHRVYMKKQFKRLMAKRSGQRPAKTQTSRARCNEKKRRAQMIVSPPKRNTKRVQCATQTKGEQLSGGNESKHCIRREQEMLPPSPVSSGIPSPASTCAYSLHSPESDSACSDGDARLQHFRFQHSWMDENTRSPTSFSDGSDDVMSPSTTFPPSPAATPFRDDLSTSGESCFSLRSQPPMGLTHTAHLLNRSCVTESHDRAYDPPRLHHLDQADLFTMPAKIKATEQKKPSCHVMAPFSSPYSTRFGYTASSQLDIPPLPTHSTEHHSSLSMWDWPTSGWSVKSSHY